MSFKLHPECAKRMKDVIVKTLRDVTVRNRQFFVPESLFGFLEADKVIPQSLQQQLHEYINETPVFSFLFGFLSRELYETQSFDNDCPSCKLSEIAGYEDLNAFASRLVEEFKSLPWEYTLTIPLPNQIGEFVGRAIKMFSFSDDICIVTPDDNFLNEYPLVSGIAARDRGFSDTSANPWLFPHVTPQWSQQNAYLQVQVKGFIAKYVTTATIENAVGLVKAFCGIGIALRLFEMNRPYRAAPAKAIFYVHRKIAGKWVVEGTHESDSLQSAGYHDLTLEDLDAVFEILSIVVYGAVVGFFLRRQLWDVLLHLRRGFLESRLVVVPSR